MAARVAVLLLAVSLLIPLVASGPLESAADESEPPASTAADLLDTDRLPLAEEDNAAVIVEEPTRGEGESDDGLTEPVPVAEATPATGEPPVGASHEPAPLAPGPEPPIAAPSASPAPPARAVGPRVEGPQYGMNIFIWGSPATTARDLERLTEARFGWQKSLFEWRAIEPRKGVFDWAEAERVVEASNAAGLQVIARVDFPPRWARADGRNGPPNRYQDYADFVFALADHFKPGSPHGTISAIQLWNEPNLSREWGSGTIGPASAAEYVRLMCGAHRAAKRANPEVITISAGLAPTGVMDGTAAEDTAYLQWMYDSGARGCFDALGAHAPGFKAPPWISPQELASNTEWGGHASFGFRRVEQLREIMVRNGDAQKQVWIQEFGWTTDTVHPAYAWHRVSERDKGRYIVEAYRWAYFNWRPWIGVMSIWTMAAPDWTRNREEYWWSITNPDGSARPAYEALLQARLSGYLPSS